MKGAVWFVCIEPYLNSVRLTSFNIFLFTVSTGHIFQNGAISDGQISCLMRTH